MSDAAQNIPEFRAPILTTAEVISLADVVAARTAKFTAMVDSFEAGARARGEEVAKSFAAAGVPRRDADRAVGQAEAKARAEIVNTSEDARWTTIRELNASAESVSTVANMFVSPQAVLARAGLGQAERTHYQQQLEGSGIVELRNMAALAVATQNRVLGAAIMSVVDRMPRRDRPISTADLAERLVGDETRAMQKAIATVRHEAQRAILANRNLERGRAASPDRIRMALNNPQKETN